MTKLQAIREFTSFVLEEKVTIARDRFPSSNWAMDIDNPTPRLKLPRDLAISPDEDDKMFRKNFIERCPLARGFSHATLTILHECGHWATRSVMNIVVYENMISKVETQEQYMSNPYEMLATQWAICWLMCPANRKVAKEFERNFFNYGNKAE